MIEFLMPVFLFAFTSSVTPGPNNMMLTSSGATFGFRRTLPHMVGIAFGFPAMVFIIGLGLAQIFIASPLLQQVLKFISILYFLYLAWRIALSGRSTSRSVSKPLNFFQAAAFQWVNPKAWIMAIGAIGAYTHDGENRLGEIILIVACFFISGLFSNTLWAGFGTVIGKWLSSHLRLRVFNVTIAILLLASLIPVLTSLK